MSRSVAAGPAQAGPAAGRRRSSRGMVTAETALALPVLLLVTIALVWLVGVGIAQVRIVDAARDAARMLARDDSTGEALARAESVAPDGAVVEVSRGSGLVSVRVRYRASPPVAILGDVGGIDLSATAQVPTEDSGGGG